MSEYLKDHQIIRGRLEALVFGVPSGCFARIADRSVEIPSVLYDKLLPLLNHNIRLGRLDNTYFVCFNSDGDIRRSGE